MLVQNQTTKVEVEEDEFMNEVDSAAIDAIEDVRDELLKKSQVVVSEMTRPSVLYRPTLSKTQYAWKVTYGEFHVLGATPDMAMKNFDTGWIRRSANA